jgi:hypothetical protein
MFALLQTSNNMPSRREALFGLLGAGLGVGVTTAYYKSKQTHTPALSTPLLYP